MIILILFIGFLFTGFLLWRWLIRTITCPDCRGEDRWNPCEVCGEKGTIQRGSNNPIPRGSGFRGTGRGERHVIPKTGRTHGKGWHRDRGGLIS